jgi:hypothetical protein
MTPHTGLSTTTLIRAAPMPPKGPMLICDIPYITCTDLNRAMFFATGDTLTLDLMLPNGEKLVREDWKITIPGAYYTAQAILIDHRILPERGFGW